MRKAATLCFLLLLALATTGAGYAHWSQTLYVDAEVNTGELCWGFEDASFLAKDPIFPPPDQHESTWDWTCELGLTNVEQLDKNVGYTTGMFITAKGTHEGETIYEKLELTLANVYPSYYNEISVVVANCGTIPVVFQKLLIDGTEVAQGDLYVNDYMEFRWLNGISGQLDPCDETELSFKVHIIEEGDYSGMTGAQPGETYTFTIELVGVQWNLS